MTQKKPTKKPGWAELAGASKAKLDEEAVNGGVPPKAKTSEPEPEPTHATIQRSALTSKWPQLSFRVHPGLKEAYVLTVNSGSHTGREIMTEAMEMWFLKHEPVNDYTRELHERANN